MLELEVQGPIATVTLNRPQKLNALGPWFWEHSAAIFGEIDERDDIRVAILKVQGTSYGGPRLHGDDAKDPGPSASRWSATRSNSSARP